MKFMESAIKEGLFLAEMGKITVLARKRAVFLAAKVANKRDTLERVSP